MKELLTKPFLLLPPKSLHQNHLSSAEEHGIISFESVRAKYCCLAVTCYVVGHVEAAYC